VNSLFINSTFVIFLGLILNNSDSVCIMVCVTRHRIVHAVENALNVANRELQDSSFGYNVLRGLEHFALLRNEA
jgi:hypothetical protein